jgi:hypothetical protein
MDGTREHHLSKVGQIQKHKSHLEDTSKYKYKHYHMNMIIYYIYVNMFPKVGLLAETKREGKEENNDTE